MQVRTFVCVVVTLCGSFAQAQRVQDQEPWSVGGGLQFGVPAGAIGPAAALGSPGSLGIVTPPLAEPVLTLERRVGSRVSLIGGISASFGRADTEGEQVTPLNPQARKSQQGGTSLSAGVRLRTTSDEAPVAVSVYGVLTAGYSAVEVSQPMQPQLQPEPILVQTLADTFGGGISAGMSAEKVLTQGLSVRVSTSLVGASYSNTFIRVKVLETERESTTSALNLGLRIVPSVELRLHF